MPIVFWNYKIVLIYYNFDSPLKKIIFQLLVIFTYFCCPIQTNNFRNEELYIFIQTKKKYKKYKYSIKVLNIFTISSKNIYCKLRAKLKIKKKECKSKFHAWEETDEKIFKHKSGEAKIHPDPSILYYL